MHFRLRLHPAHPGKTNLSFQKEAMPSVSLNTYATAKVSDFGGKSKNIRKSWLGKCHFGGAWPALYHSHAQMQEFSTGWFSIHAD
jgi:hypothetical protein